MANINVSSLTSTAYGSFDWQTMVNQLIQVDTAPITKLQAEETANKAIEILQDLVKEYPNVPDFRYDLSETYAMQNVRRPLSSKTANRSTERQSREMLEKAGIEVLFPEGQTCCGAPARYNGAYEVAAQNAQDNIKALLETEVSYVVSACPTCTVALKYDFIDTFKSVGVTDAMEAARQLSAKTIDFSTLVKKLVDAGRLTFKEGEELGRITYHDSCHLKRTLKASDEPRELLKQAGHEIAEMYECDTCCGMAGSYSLKLPEISAPILERKLKNIKDTGASKVVMDCPGCVMQIRGGLDKDGSPIHAEHTVERLADRFK